MQCQACSSTKRPAKNLPAQNMLQRQSYMSPQRELQQTDLQSDPGICCSVRAILPAQRLSSKKDLTSQGNPCLHALGISKHALHHDAETQSASDQAAERDP